MIYNETKVVCGPQHNLHVSLEEVIQMHNSFATDLANILSNILLVRWLVLLLEVYAIAPFCGCGRCRFQSFFFLFDLYL